MSAEQPVNYGRIITNMITTMLTEVVNKLSPLIILHIAQKRLGVEMFGLAQYAIVFLEVLLPFVAFGYGTLGAIEVGRFNRDKQKTGEFISSVLGLRFIHLISVVIIGGILVSQPVFAEARPIMLCISFLLVAACFETEFLHYGQQTLSIRNLIVVGSKLVSVGGVLLLVRNDQDASTYAVLATLPALIVSAGSAFYNLRDLPLRLPSTSELRKLFVQALPYAFVIFLITLSDRFDVFFAEYFLDKKGAGLYAGQLRIVQSFATATSAFGLVFFTELVLPRPKEEFTKYVHYTLTAVLLFITPIVIGGLFVDADILRLIYTEEFVPHAKVLDILMLSALAGTFFQVFGVYILMIKQRVRFFIGALGIANVIGIMTAAALATPYGLPGIAIGNLTTKVLAAILFIWGTREYLSRFPLKPVVQVTGCAGFMAVVLYLIKPETLVMNIVIGGVAYAAASTITHFQFIKIMKKRLIDRQRPAARRP